MRTKTKIPFRFAKTLKTNKKLHQYCERSDNKFTDGGF